MFFASNLNAQTNLVLNPSFEQYPYCPVNDLTLNGLANCPDFWYKQDRRNAIFWSSCSNGAPNGKGGVPRNIVGGISYQYEKTWLQNGVAIDSLRPGFWVKPLVNTCYVLTQTVNGYTSSDTVCVTVKPLPLQITNYELRITNETRNGNNEKRVTSNWTTANEINVSHFNILKSDDGVNFKAIGQVKATWGGIYNFIDELNIKDQYPKTLYYRIAAIDQDGKMNFSETKKITFNAPLSTFNLFPNPSKANVTIECKGMKEVNVINQLGQVVYRQIASGTNLRNDANKINTQQFANGVYIVQIITKNNEVKNVKLVLE